MKKHILNIVKSIVFVGILVTSLYFINLILEPKYYYRNSVWPTTSTYNQFYEMEDNSIDVLFLGSSVAVNAFDTQALYNEYGITSYNLGSEQQSPVLSYFWLKEALKTQNPKVVILESNFLARIHPESMINMDEPLTRKCIDPMAWSDVKAEAIDTICELDASQSKNSYYLTNIRFHSRWNSMEKQDFLPKEAGHAELKGYGPTFQDGPLEFVPFVPTGGTEYAGGDAFMLEYVEKIRDLCKGNRIRLLVVSLPNSVMNDGINNMLNDLAEDTYVDYINFNLEENYKLLNANLPYENTTKHANIWGARKISEYLGKVMSEEYGLSSHVEEQFEATRPYYDHILKNGYIRRTTTIDEYMQAINDPDYTIFMVVKGETDSFGTSEALRQATYAFRITSDVLIDSRNSFAAVIHPGDTPKEGYGPEKQVVVGKIEQTDDIYRVESLGYYAGNRCSISINGKEYAKCIDGLNLVIYDNVTENVVDSVRVSDIIEH